MSISDRFRTENPEEWSDDDLQDALLQLSRDHILNDMVRHRAIIQALTVLNIQNRRHIEKIEKRNSILTGVIVVLTSFSIISSLINL